MWAWRRVYNGQSRSGAALRQANEHRPRAIQPGAVRWGNLGTSAFDPTPELTKRVSNGTDRSLCPAVDVWWIKPFGARVSPMSGPERACQLSVEVHDDQWLVLNDQHVGGGCAISAPAHHLQPPSCCSSPRWFDHGTTAACGMRVRKTRAAFSWRSGNKGLPGAFPPMSSTREIIQ
jgi:hypothetical protein